MFLLLVYVFGALSISFLCSILEAALLSVRGVELEERKARGERGAEILLHLKRKRIDDAISAILILNTIAHTVGATLAGYQAGEVYGDEYVEVFAGVLTLLILFFTEIIPKTLGTVHASTLVPFVARTLQGLVWSLKPALYVTRLLTGFLARHEKKLVTRGELAAMVAMAAREGTLGDADSKLVSNVLRYDEIKVQDVMTPRTVVCALPAQATFADLLADEKAHVFSRIPVYEGTPDHVVGYVLQRDVLAEIAKGADPATPLSEHAREALHLPEQLSVRTALRRLTEGRRHLALVLDEFGGVSGLVTLEDLVETLLGIEILDESDRVADLRVEAVRLREKRLAARFPGEVEGAGSAGP